MERRRYSPESEEAKERAEKPAPEGEKSHEERIRDRIENEPQEHPGPGRHAASDDDLQKASDQTSEEGLERPDTPAQAEIDEIVRKDSAERAQKEIDEIGREMDERKKREELERENE